jgi:hypothetical protein
MFTAIALILASACFSALAFAVKRGPGVVGDVFVFSKAFLVALGVVPFAWLFIALIIFFHGLSDELAGIGLFVYWIVALFLSANMFYCYFWYKTYSIKIIKDGLVVHKINGDSLVLYKDISCLNLIEGKDYNFIILKLKSGRKIKISGLLDHFDDLSDKVIIKLRAGGADIKKRSYAGRWIDY